MKFQDIKIGTQLRLGLGLILIFVLLLGVLSWRQGNLLWLETRTMYDHPLQVRRAVGKLETNSHALSHYLRDLLASKTSDQRAVALKNIELFRKDSEQKLQALRKFYLGPAADIKTLQDALTKWGTIHNETIRLFQNGRRSDAAARHRPGGIGDHQARAVRDALQVIDDFAGNKSDQLYADARTLSSTLTLQLIGILVLILLLTVFIAYRLLRSIDMPLRRITLAANKIRHGQLDVRSGYRSDNEFGQLSAAFDALADTTQSNLQIKEKAVLINTRMARETELHSFCKRLIEALVGQTDSQIGAIYLLNARQDTFEHFESIGLGAEKRFAFSAAVREGEFGMALATGQMQRITDIPEDTRFSFATVSGEFKPREIITLPLSGSGAVKAVLSLASIHPFDCSAIQLLEEISSALAAHMNGVLFYQQIQQQAELLANLNHEQEMQNKELAAQANELTEQNTELEMQKNQLREASELKSTFLSNMSHELRTPLNSVIALSGVLNRRLEKIIPEEEHSYLDVIERNGKNLLALINDILDLSRIEAGREEINIEQFPVREWVSEIIENIKPQSQEKNIALLNEVSDNLPPLTSDYTMCCHILQNLIANAVKFTDAGTVAVSARQLDDDILVSVRDTGIGIAPDQLTQIFDEFQQADGSASRKHGGTGLGLSIAKRYATLLQGSITVESVPGQGSTFTLRLPLRQSTPGPYPVADSKPVVSVNPQSPSTVGSGQSILVVDDSEPALIQITDMLSVQGYQVQVANNGKEALTQIAKNLPAAMILDLMMPEMDGFEVLSMIRENFKSAHLPVLILTARHVTRKELAFLEENNVQQLILKGDISKNELLNAIARMLAPAQTAKSPPQKKTSRKSASGKPRILIVEDNPDNMMTIKALLQDRCILFEASDGQTGIEQAKTHMPDLILMDLALPVMDGYAALALIREEEALRHIPVVAVTARAMKGDRQEILAHGFDAYLSKPIDDQILNQTILELLDGS